MIRLERDKDNSYNSPKHLYYFFLCECGTIVSRRVDNKAKYCNKVGCPFSSRIRHGNSKTPLYGTWEGIKQRITNPKAKSSLTYYHKGIKLTEEWLIYPEFEKWALANGWKQGLTIDRIDIDGDYTPENCRWVTRSENSLLQHKDGHGTSKAVSCIIENGTQTTFSSIKDCTEYMQNSKEIFKTKTYKSLSYAIQRSILNKKDYYGWTFKYE